MEKKLDTTIGSTGFSKIVGLTLGPYNEAYNILGSMLGSPILVARCLPDYCTCSCDCCTQKGAWDEECWIKRGLGLRGDTSD